ncbi:MAG: hypothetical protein WAM91_03665 [Candidatus Acidiferrales bacterium]
MSLKRTVLVVLVLIALGVGVVKSQPQADHQDWLHLRLQACVR